MELEPETGPMATDVYGNRERRNMDSRTDPFVLYSFSLGCNGLNLVA